MATRPDRRAPGGGRSGRPCGGVGSSAPGAGSAGPVVAPAGDPGPAGTPETGIRSSVIYPCDTCGDAAPVPTCDVRPPLSAVVASPPEYLGSVLDRTCRD